MDPARPGEHLAAREVQPAGGFRHRHCFLSWRAGTRDRTGCEAYRPAGAATSAAEAHPATAAVR